MQLKRSLGFIVALPISVILCVLPFEPGILPLETLFDSFGLIPASVYIASLWFLYLLGIPAALAGALNQLPLLQGVCIAYAVALIGLAVLYSRTDGPDWYFRILVCVLAPLPLVTAYSVGHVIRHRLIAVNER